MYGRSHEGQELTFEASGALESASLVMRDRETDSWWSLMSSRAIGGEFDGSRLEELPVSEKAQWSDWLERHPDTLVLSIDGVEHVENNPYDNYFAAGSGTFRGVEVADERLPPKEPVYAFWFDDRPMAISHRLIEGGAFARIPGADDVIAFWRAEGSSVYASSRALILDAPTASRYRSATALFEAVDSGQSVDSQPAGGFDTFWYTWVGVNSGTELLAP